MNKQLLLVFFALVFAPISILAQNPTCGGLFTDPQGPNANYANNLDYTVTLFPSNPNEVVTVTFTSFDVETNFDGLYIYNGNSTNAPQFSSGNAAGIGPMILPGAFWGTTNPGSFTSTSTDGSLTFRFISDSFVNKPGWIANVTCASPGTCLTPNNITGTNFTSSSATINWVETGNATNWEIIILPVSSPAPTNETSGTATTSTTFQATGLNAGTAYRVYIRAICSDEPGDVSNWSNFMTFTTLSNGCLPPTDFQVSNITNTGATLNFANNSATNWEVIVLPSSSGLPTTTSVGTIVTSPTHTVSGLNAATAYNFFTRSNCNGIISNWSAGTYFLTAQNPVVSPNCGEQFIDNGGANANYASNSDNTYTICPTNPGEVVTVTFTSFDIETLWDGLYVFDGNSINSPQISSGNPGNSIPGGVPGAFWGTVIPGPFTSTSADGCLTFRFRSDNVVNKAGWIANVTCGTPSTCLRPTNVVVSAITTNSAVIGWTSGSNETSWEIVALPCGTAPTPNTTGVITNTNPYTLENLTLGTCYTIYVKAICSDTEMSQWSVATTFTTLVSCPSPQQVNASNITTTSFTLNWFETGSATSWEVITQPCGSTAPTSTSTGTLSTTNSITVENLNSSACYHVYIRSVCSDSDKSTWTGPITVETLNASLACGSNFYDLSGPSANYANNLDYVVTICPNNPGELVTVTFTEFDTEANWDGLLVYDGSSTNSPQISSTNGAGLLALANFTGAFWGNTIPGPFTSSSPDGCLTFRFISDFAITRAGWSANVTCVPDNDKIVLIAFVDSNNNGTKDENEQNFSNGSFLIDLNDTGNPTSAYSPIGMYSLYDTNPLNSYDISYEIQPNYSAYYSAGTTNYSNLTIPTGSNYQVYYFPITVVQGYNDVTASLVSINPPPRPGFTYKNKVVYKNLGLTPTAGTLTFTKDPLVTITNVSQEGTVANENGFTYSFVNLAPNETRFFYVTMTVPTIPTVALGDVLTNVVTISAPADDIDLENNSFSNAQIIVGSWDPNDKMESHGGKILITEYEPSDYLYYTIRFQNEGTANAEFVIIEDALDNQIDETSIQMVNASHNYLMTRVDNEIKWEFRNINLVPKIVNEEASNGFVLFKVKLKPGISVGDIVSNTASIIFDFNPSIFTNTFDTEFIPLLSNPSFATGYFEMYPNPANATVQLSLYDANDTIKKVNVYDLLGKQIMSFTSDVSIQTLDVSSLSSGIYMIEITTQNNLTSVKKLVKK